MFVNFLTSLKGFTVEVLVINTYVQLLSIKTGFKWMNVVFIISVNWL